MNTSPQSLFNFKLAYLGLNKEDEANRIGDEWKLRITVLKRGLTEQVNEKKALVAVENEDGYLLYNEYMSYVVLHSLRCTGFQMDEAAKDDVQDSLFDLKTARRLSRSFEADYMLKNKKIRMMIISGTNLSRHSVYL